MVKQTLDHEVRVSMSLSPTIQFLADAEQPVRLNPQNKYIYKKSTIVYRLATLFPKLK